MHNCTAVVSWSLTTQFSTSCPLFAACVHKHGTTTSSCDCTSSDMFLVNGTNNTCARSAMTSVVVGFWAALGLWCVYAAFRMCKSMSIPQPEGTTTNTPKQRGSHFQRCKWINLISIVWLLVWCAVRVVRGLTLPSTTGPNVLAGVGFVVHAVLIFSFFFSIVELALTLAVVLVSTNRMRSADFGTTPTQQLLLSGFASAFLVALVLVPSFVFLHFISALMFGVVMLFFVGVFCFVLVEIANTIRNKRQSVVSAMRPVYLAYRSMAIALVVCFCSCVALAVVELVAQTSPKMGPLAAARFAVTATQHISIAVFQYLVTQIANVIQTRRRQTLEESGSLPRRQGSKDSYRSNRTNWMSDSPRSVHTARSQAPPVVVFAGAKPISPSASHSPPKRSISHNNADIHKTSHHSLTTSSGATNSTTSISTTTTSSGGRDTFLAPPGVHSGTMPQRPSPLRNMALRASGSSGEEDND